MHDFEFDPTQDPSWTLAMVLLWAHSRDRQLVAVLSEDYRAEEKLPRVGDASVLGFHARTSGLDLDKAFKQIKRAGKAGKLTTTAWLPLERRREPVTRIQWEDATLEFTAALEAAIRVDDARLEELRFPIADVLSIWPEPAKSQQKPGRPEFLSKVIDEIKARWPDGRYPNRDLMAGIFAVSKSTIQNALREIRSHDRL